LDFYELSLKERVLKKGLFFFLLSLGIVSVDTLQSSPLKLIHHILAAARICVRKCWKNEHARSKDMWFGLCEEVADMDRITSILQHRQHRYEGVWSEF
jgi:hypothetical protein